MLPQFLLDTKNLQKWAKTAHKKNFFLPEKSLGQSSPQELEVGPRSGPYLVVLFKVESFLMHDVSQETTLFNIVSKLNYLLGSDSLYIQENVALQIRITAKSPPTPSVKQSYMDL